MSKMIFLDSRIFVGGADLSGSSSKVMIGEEWEAKPTTNFRSGGATEVVAGLGKIEASGEGQWEVGDASRVDDAMWASRRVVEPWSVAPDGTSDLAPGNLMYLTSALRTQARLWGAVGEVAGWNATAKGSKPLVRGQSAHASGVPRTATGNGTAVQLGSLPAGRKLYANLHVLSVAGTSAPSIAVKVQSDDAVGFPSATDRGSFTTRTAIGGEQIEIAAPITDDWWRVAWTITGVGPSFLFLVSFGIE